MQKFLTFIRTLKITYILYNLVHYRRLLSNRNLYQKYGLKKSVFAPISSSDFRGFTSEIPWLDREDAHTAVVNHPEFAAFSPEIQQQILGWIDHGFLILKQFISSEKVAQINEEVDRLIREKVVSFHASGRIMFAYRQSAIMKVLVADKMLVKLMSFLTGKKMKAFQSINFLKGSQQRPHSDSIHMTTFPLGYLTATWLALEDVNDQNGGLIYYPGSHKLPYILNNDFPYGGGFFTLGSDANRHYEDKIEALIKEYNLQPATFVAQPGDLLIWHANLIHGGHPIQKAGSTRKSMVVHYFAEDVIAYHEMTQRPALRWE
ncbi:MAG: phytanoyl-CoA dioxygenase family protein [Bacteroidia bacterium]|nr:phytanoyl-CoA dioxygenase family protein [Bacteroidia bacterium]